MALRNAFKQLIGGNASPLHAAVETGNFGEVCVQVQKHPNRINEPEPQNGWTPLHIAASQGFDVIVRELLARGASPNFPDKTGRTPLHMAAVKGNVAVIKALLSSAGDPDRKDYRSKTPIDVAQESGQQQALALLQRADGTDGWGRAQTMAPQQPQQPQRQQSGRNTGYPAAGDFGTPPQAAYGMYGNHQQQQHPQMAHPPHQQPQQQQQQQQPSYPPAAYPPPQWNQGGQQQQQQRPQGAAMYPAVGRPGTIQQYDSFNNNIANTNWASSLPAAPPAAGATAPTPAYPYSFSGGGEPTAPPAAVGYFMNAPPAPHAVAPPRPLQQMYPGMLAETHVSSHPIAADTSFDEGDGWPAGMPQYISTGNKPPPPPPPPRRPTGGAGTGSTGPSKPDEEEGGWGEPAKKTDWGDSPLPDSPQKRTGGLLAFMRRTDTATATQQQQGGAAGGGGRPGLQHTNSDVGELERQRQRLAGVQLGPPPPPPPASVASQRPASSAVDSGSVGYSGPPGRIYSYEDLYRATKGFAESNKLGMGGFGPVYRGSLDGIPVAIKVMDTSAGSMQGMKEFQKEISILGRLHHPHLVLLIGSCPERGMLVYELMEAGSLEDHLFKPNMPDLPWQDRVRIAAETASALTFLHSSPEPIIHMDLKPGNILLSRDRRVSKVGDVGLARLAPDLALGGGRHVSAVQDTRLVGTLCYMDPEYLRTGRFGQKSDVYSLGIVMLQLLTGRDVAGIIENVERALTTSRTNFASILSVVDRRAGPWPPTEAVPFAHLAISCVAMQRNQRPELRSQLLPGLQQLVERSQAYSTASNGGSSSTQQQSQGGGADSNQVPAMFLCPITTDIMESPVFAADGYSYEQSAIEQWTRQHSTSPMTNLPLAHMHLTPNLALRSAIKEWRERHPNFSYSRIV